MEQSNQKKIRIAVLQRVCTNYRTALFRSLNLLSDFEVLLIIGDDIPNTKVKNTKNFSGINHVKLKTKTFSLFGRIMTYHGGLVDQLNDFDPDVILCEGESHFLGYLNAIYYKLRVKNNVRLIHWCFISLPGEEDRINGIPFKIKGFFRRYFDGFLLYSNFSKMRLKDMGIEEDRMFVATNVGGVEQFLKTSDSFKLTKSEAKVKLGLADQFVALYVGTMEGQKKPELILSIAEKFKNEECRFLMLGSGPSLEGLKNEKEKRQLNNVVFTGRVTTELPLYYHAADVLVIPGRGGITISEGMSFGLPVIVHQADGTEYDLVTNDETGFRLSKGDANDFKQAIEYLIANPTICRQMGEQGKHQIETKFNTENMTKQIVKAAISII